MNEQTAKLIEQLASKLGTTAEHLWGVLVRQAPISATVGILCDALLIIAVYLGWKKLLKVNFDNWDNDMGKGMLFGGLAIATAICLCAAFGSLQTEVAGFLNPEYWAIKQILK